MRDTVIFFVGFAVSMAMWLLVEAIRHEEALVDDGDPNGD